jgi:hypothetical protein
MRDSMRRFQAACAASEPAIRQRAFAALIAIAVLVDLSAFELPRFLLWGPRQFHMPWLPIWPELAPTGANTLIMHGATALACLGANAMYWGRAGGAWLVFAVYAYAFLDHQPSYTNNGYLLLLLLIAIGTSDLRGTTRAWPRLFAQLTLSAMYAAAGLSKLDATFLSGSTLGQALVRYSPRYEALIGIDSPALFALASRATLVLELALAVGLWLPRARRVLIPLGIALHVGIEVLMPVRFFSFLCIASYVLFAQAETVEAWLVRARRIAHPALWLPALVVAIVLLESPWYGISRSGSAIVACSIAAGIAIWGRKQPLPPPPAPTSRSRIGVFIVSAAIVLQAFCALKPLLGFSKRFAWQMFSEVLIMRVETLVHADGRFRRARFAGAQSRWREDGYRYHWTSWSEERIYLAGYAEWLAQTYALSEVRVVASYRRNDAPERRAEFTAHNPN